MDKNEVVQYDNALNTLDFSGFKASELDLFMVMCLSISEKGKARIEIPYRTIMNNTFWGKKSVSEFHEYLKKEYKSKIFSLNFLIDVSEDEYQGYILFDWFSANRKKQILTLEVSNSCERFFNNISKNFTMLDLAIYGKMQSKYSKLLYQHLCQFRDKKGKGWWQVSVSDFRKLFDVPEAYLNKRIMGDIINPSIKELSSYMDIKCEVLRGEGKGRPVCAYKFIFSEIKQKLVEDKKNVVKTKNGTEILIETMEEKHQNAIDEDKIICNLRKICKKLSVRDCLSIIDDMNKYERSETDVYKIVEYSTNQNTDNLVGYIRNLLKKGISNKIKNVKKSSFHFENERDYNSDDLKDLEEKLLSN